MDGTAPEVCGECGFDSRLWQVRDAASLLGALGWWWRHAVAGIAADALNARPADGVWSVLEYGAHSALTTAVLRHGIEAILANDGAALPPVPDPGADSGPVTLDPAAIVADLEREGTAFARLARTAPSDAWSHMGHAGAERYEARAALLHAAHDASHHQMDVGRGLESLGMGMPAGPGRVVQVNASDGGVPKRSVPSATIAHHGLVGDRQADRKHHGRPFQALCLWSAEVIEALAADGHTIGAGCAGENVTVAGVDWKRMRPGARLRLGTALAEISFAATPCAKQSRWFSDGDFGRIDHDRNPHLTRWYAWVREPGAVAEGDAVTVSGSGG